MLMQMKPSFFHHGLLRLRRQLSWQMQIAVTGKGFFRSSAIATDLIMNNILRIGKVNVIGDVVLSLEKLCVSLASALFSMLMLDTYKYKSAHNKISSPLFPVLMMIETDSPYCDIKNTHAGIKMVKSSWPSRKKEKYDPECHVKGRNEPCLVRQVLEVVAECKGIEIEQLGKSLNHNTCRVFFPQDLDAAADVLLPRNDP